MAFFENLGDQISAFGKRSYSKAKDLSESARLSAMVSEEERTVSDIYYQIGRLYASNHKADYEACFAELFARLAKSEDNIQYYKQQIMDLRGVQCCDRCGAEVPKGSQFCSACGAPVKPFVPAGCTLCPKCGAAVKNGMNFCTSCGHPMNRPAERNGIPTPPAPKPERAAYPESAVHPEPVSKEDAPYDPPVYMPEPERAVYPEPAGYPEPVSKEDAPYDPPVYMPEPERAAYPEPAVYPEPVSKEDAPYDPPVYMPNPASSPVSVGPDVPQDGPAPLYDEPASAEPIPNAYPEPAVPHCPHCGAELEPDSVFCSECGQRV